MHWEQQDIWQAQLSFSIVRNTTETFQNQNICFVNLHLPFSFHLIIIPIKYFLVHVARLGRISQILAKNFDIIHPLYAMVRPTFKLGEVATKLPWNAASQLKAIELIVKWHKNDVKSLEFMF